MWKRVEQWRPRDGEDVKMAVEEDGHVEEERENLKEVSGS